MEMKTFQTLIDEKGDAQIFPVNILSDTALINTIKEWFNYRYLGDTDDRFITFFKRLLIKDYKRYNELLRVEPGISEYDWLVQVYRERQRHNDDTTTKTDSSTTTTDTTETTHTSGTVTGTNGNTRTLNTLQNVQTTKDGQNSDSEQTTTSNDRTIVDGVTRTDNTTQNSSLTDNNAKMAFSSQEGMSKSAPMSLAYSNNGAIHNVNFAIGDDSMSTEEVKGLDFTYADAQTIGSGHTWDKARDTSTGEIRNTGTVSTTRNATDNADIDKSSTISHTIDEEGTSQKTDTGTITDAGSKSETTASQSAHDVDGTVTNSGTGETQFYGLEQEIYTGRDKEIAELLARACTFITQTSAWEWLYDELNKCFYGIYE